MVKEDRTTLGQTIKTRRKYLELMHMTKEVVAETRHSPTERGCELCVSMCDCKRGGVEKMSRTRFIFYRSFLKGWQRKSGILIPFYEASYILINVKLIYT